MAPVATAGAFDPGDDREPEALAGCIAVPAEDGLLKQADSPQWASSWGARTAGESAAFGSGRRIIRIRVSDLKRIHRRVQSADDW